MQTLIYEGQLTALTSIAHSGGETLGIETKLRRERFVQPDGTVEEVPLLSGNGLRGRLRDIGMWHMCKSLGYGVNESTGCVSGMPLSAFYFLFSGGALSENGGAGIDIDYARKLRAAIPLISLFGGAVGKQILPGKIKVGKAIPICTETAHLLPAAYQPMRQLSVWDFLQTEMYTRKDDEKNEKLRAVITPSEAAKQMSPGKAIKREDIATTIAPQYPLTNEKRKPQQMMYLVESFAPGTRFYWKLILEDVTEIEYDAFMTTLAEFSRLPYVGGKSAVGLGEVAIKFDNWLEIDSRLQSTSSKLARPAGTAYARHLETGAASIREMILSI